MMAKGGAYSFGSDRTPQIDGGLGLVIRLNILFNKADRAALAGDNEEWDHVLDRVFINLCYREPMDIEIINGECKRAELIKEDIVVYNLFSKKIKDTLKKRRVAILQKNRKDLEQAKEEYYRILCEKDIWLRKVMNDLGLYIKEVSFNPATALFGG